MVCQKYLQKMRKQFQISQSFWKIRLIFRTYVDTSIIPFFLLQGSVLCFTYKHKKTLSKLEEEVVSSVTLPSSEGTNVKACQEPIYIRVIVLQNTKRRRFMCCIFISSNQVRTFHKAPRKSGNGYRALFGNLWTPLTDGKKKSPQ